ncbi:AAA ATPase OS=Tsukamurella paurometabola (strain ATCC 8368 / DSM / CCUG 35730 / CIP 100753 /JCM 10117 / KCTC 9821 / NBRC 16120 / NCIMB 702349 / NCTC 13040)OX=521096 GN=Tpau_1795 PE=4 SV=1 [Tsukamurella paurometabola]|uniref:AAA ATPase n=1 Tax=Tsukamurella paurometabola (strain ATCC 8368 / DSM 20162 / CCUG 35730 / CIP 100753 / JCM 10117 / KCTC 9821 / NBRC 16120 / NCIMB 702349 / NCTC 13040) TaxID=521096 RepID=D5UMD3_TSUPD|nr:AAA family ATPase [Tsukamurella paurometabola]ADG78413.1 AAA ATPase [Tsukamurella paurometabola DSM 20162]SUP31539.1 cytochrome c biogenesis protein CcmA [Tsukamurella paurometabola]
MFARRISVAPEAGSGAPRWVRDVPALRPLFDGAAIDLTAPLTFVVGENGSGKSTLVEAVAEQFGLDARGGRASVPGGNVDTEKTPLGEVLRLDLTHRGRAMRRGPRLNRKGFFLRAETVLEMNERFNGWHGYWEHDVNTQSHGEGFFTIIDAMLTDPGFYVLDEPESALSFHSCLRLVAQLGELRDSGSQLICATHSPILSATPGAQIIEMRPTGPTDTAWADLAVVQHWRRFLNQPETYLGELVTAPDAPEPDAPRTVAPGEEEAFIARLRERIYRED